jgi:hypothetical protein
MLDWAAESELLIMLIVLGLLMAELINIRRTIRRDKAKAARQQTNREV